MGFRKFYRTPEGKFLAQQLSRSGVVYSSGTIQHRYLLKHFIYSELVKQAKEKWFAARIADLYDAVVVPYMELGPRSTHKNKVMDTLQSIMDIVSPISRTQQTLSSATEKSASHKATEEDKEKYINLLGDKPFKSMKDIVDKVSDIKKLVASAKAATEQFSTSQS